MARTGYARQGDLAATRAAGWVRRRDRLGSSWPERAMPTSRTWLRRARKAGCADAAASAAPGPV